MQIIFLTLASFFFNDYPLSYHRKTVVKGDGGVYSND